MTLALSTRYLGRRPYPATRILETLRAVGVRDVGLSDATPQPAADSIAAVLGPVGSKVVAVEARFTPEHESDSAPTLLSHDPRNAAAAMRVVRHAASIAKVVGTRIVVVHLGDHAVERRRERHAELRARLTTHGVDAETERLARALAADLDKRLEADLDRVCRGLFELSHAEPEIRFAVATPESFAGFPNHRALGLLLSEMRGRDIGYWHDAGVARLHEKVGLARPNSFAGDHAASIVGVAAHDVAGAEMHLPPGSGEIDFRQLREVLPSAAHTVIEVESRSAPREIALAAEFLRSLDY